MFLRNMGEWRAALLEDGAAYSAANLEVVDDPGEEEIDTSENPHSLHLEIAVAQRRTHALDANVGVGTIGGGEDAGYGFPEGWDRGSGPADTTQEEQWDGHEDKQQDAVLTMVDEAGPEHSHKGAGCQVGHEESYDLPEMAEIGEPEPVGDAYCHINAHEQEDEEMDEALA